MSLRLVKGSLPVRWTDSDVSTYSDARKEEQAIREAEALQRLIEEANTAATYVAVMVLVWLYLVWR